MESKTSAYYQRLYRQRLREQGLVKKEIWIRPEHSELLAGLERKLRQPASGLVSLEEERHMNMPQTWTAQALYDALSATESFNGGHIGIELIQSATPSLHLSMHEYGDLPLFLAVAGEQILVEALLWPAAAVRDARVFNEEVLRTRNLFPLSCIGIDTLPDGAACYTMLGALSSASTLADVLLEIELLAANVIKATEAYEDFLQAAA